MIGQFNIQLILDTREEYCISVAMVYSTGKPAKYVTSMTIAIMSARIIWDCMYSISEKNVRAYDMNIYFETIRVEF